MYSLDDYLAAGVLTDPQRVEFQRAVRAHRSILIAGGTNTGKTTLANALLREVTDLFPNERIVILEDTVELQCVATDHLALRTSPRVSLAQLVKSALRTSPTRIVVGEVRGSEPPWISIDAWATRPSGGRRDRRCTRRRRPRAPSSAWTGSRNGPTCRPSRP